MKQIYVHGLGQTSDSWTKTIDILQTTDYSLCPNLPDLVHSKEVTYDNLYAAFSDYCNQYDEPIDLCGLSLGGVLALNYAIQYPKKVRSLVLIATQYKMPKKLLKFQNLLFRFMPKSMFQQMGFRKADFLLLCETMMGWTLTTLCTKYHALHYCYMARKILRTKMLLLNWQNCLRTWN